MKKNAVLAVLIGCALFGLTVGHAQPSASFPSFSPLPYSPEGVAVDKVGNVYVSVGTQTSDQIWKFSPGGVPSILADLGGPGGGACGLAVDPEGNVYMARTIKAAPFHGVYKPGKDGQFARIPGTENIVFADGLAFDQRGNLYISEVFSPGAAPGTFGQGGIWRVARGGAAELWLRHDLLTGLAPTLFPFPLGANGVVFYLGSLYVINTDKALVVRIPVLPDGSPGEPIVWASVQDVPESMFYQNPQFPLMIDGLSADVHGNIYIASPSRLAVVRINAADKSQETLAVFSFMPVDVPIALLDGPFSLAFGTGTGERQNLFITSSGAVGSLVPGLPWPGPGLVKLEIGIPGLPLP